MARVSSKASSTIKAYALPILLFYLFILYQLVVIPRTFAPSHYDAFCVLIVACNDSIFEFATSPAGIKFPVLNEEVISKRHTYILSRSVPRSRWDVCLFEIICILLILIESLHGQPIPSLGYDYLELSGHRHSALCGSVSVKVNSLDRDVENQMNTIPTYWPNPIWNHQFIVRFGFCKSKLSEFWDTKFGFIQLQTINLRVKLRPSDGFCFQFKQIKKS